MPVAQRRRNAARLSTQLDGQGRTLSPVKVVAGGRKITKTFWGDSWCRNLERYSDFSNRLPRGRTYVRNGSVIDLQIAPGKVEALVSGSAIYEVAISVTRLPKARWQQLCADCAGDIDSLVELLQGRFSDGVMEVLCQPKTGLFPEPAQITMSCSCPDWATMCKHVAAVLYGIGARLDSDPELLFRLRQVDHLELVSARDGGITAATSAGAAAEELVGEDLGAIFGIELASPEPPTPERRKKSRANKQPRTRKAAAAKQPKPAAKSRRRKAVAHDPWITAAELRQRGVPNHVVQGWLHRGLVTHSGDRGIYVWSEEVEVLVREYLADARSRKRRR